MNATTLATDLYNKGLGNTWLSVKRTNWLRDLALKEHERDIRHWQRTREGCEPPPMFNNQVNGDLDLGDRHLGSWTMRVSPINGCGFFACTVSNVVDLRLQSRAEAVEVAVRRAFDQRFMDGEGIIERLTDAAAFLPWAKGYLTASHEFGAWNEYDEAVAIVLAAWERSCAASTVEVGSAVAGSGSAA